MLNKIPYELRALALEELYSLRGLITDEERGRLNFWALRPGDATLCLLAQISGDKTPNDRSNRLIALSVVPLTNYGQLQAKYGDGKPELAVEMYMRKPWAENKAAVEFLKGERAELTVEQL